MDSIRAIVQKIVTDGKHGPYVVTTSDDVDGSVTFSLDPEVWPEKHNPEPGNIVCLQEVTKKRAGWRAKAARFWLPSDEQNQQGAVTINSRFLYPKSRQYPMDEVCEQIVRQAEKRNWSIPGLTFEFDEYGSLLSGLRFVKRIIGDDFKMYFCREQGNLGNYNDIAAINTISIPEMEIDVFSDECGPRLYVYVGQNWEHDKAQFIDDIKCHSKMDGKPRLYLLYKGGFIKNPSYSNLQFTRPGKRAPYLVNDNDGGREYTAEGDEPKYYETDKVLNKFTTWLEENVLKVIYQVQITSDL